jgi:hypothetical protein
MSGRANAAGDKEIRLYAIDCGSLTFKDMSMFSDTGHYDGKKNGSMVDPCFASASGGLFSGDTGLGTLVGHDPPSTKPASDCMCKNARWSVTNWREAG